VRVDGTQQLGKRLRMQRCQGTRLKEGRHSKIGSACVQRPVKWDYLTKSGRKAKWRALDIRQPYECDRVGPEDVEIEQTLFVLSREIKSDMKEIKRNNMRTKGYQTPT